VLVAVTERILRPADNLDPLEIRNVNGRGNFGLGNRLGMIRMLGELMEEPIPE
jgi:hypothetical protein